MSLLEQEIYVMIFSDSHRNVGKAKIFYYFLTNLSEWVAGDWIQFYKTTHELKILNSNSKINYNPTTNPVISCKICKHLICN